MVTKVVDAASGGRGSSAVVEPSRAVVGRSTATFMCLQPPCGRRPGRMYRGIHRIPRGAVDQDLKSPKPGTGVVSAVAEPGWA